MKYVLTLLFCTATSNAIAGPVTIDKTQAAARVRKDPGTGLCASFINFRTQMAPLAQLDQAITLLDKPDGDAEILNRVLRVVPALNFRNADPSAVGDFSAPNFSDALFPYSTDPNAMPSGNNSNIASRLRGYLNVTESLAGSPVTFAMNCDDGCSLKIGQTKLIEIDSRILVSRMARQVVFQDPGLYPVEVVHYQNGGQAYLEWSRADSAEPDGPLVVPPPGFTNKFKLLGASELYSAIVGTNPVCQQCRSSADCGMSSYCGNGLCQTCNLAEHCGPSCISCPSATPICAKNQCMQCTADAHCSSGLVCEGATGTCVPPTPCVQRSDCAPSDRICDPEEYICVEAPPPCTDSLMCAAGQYCDTSLGYCRIRPTPCIDSSECAANQYCEPSVMHCKPRSRYVYTGGREQSGCSAVPGRANGIFGGTALAVLGLLTLAARATRRRRASIKS